MSRPQFVLSILSLVLALLTTSPATHAADPDLDATFDGDGRVQFDLNGADQSDVDATAIIANASGYIGAVLTAHSVDGNAQTTLSILQYSPSGAETTLLRGSLVRPGESSLQGVVRTALRPDGRLVVATRMLDAQSNLDMLVCQFRRGSPIAVWILDTGFGGGDGCSNVHTALAPLATDHDTFLSDLALDSQGRVVLVGGANDSATTSVPVVARFLANGDPDATFGNGGVAAFTQIDNALFDVVAIDAMDRIVTAGTRIISGTDYDGVLTRLAENGSIDPGFGHREIAFNLGNTYDYDLPRAVAVESGGEVTMLLAVVDGNVVKPAIARFDASGEPSSTLGGLTRRIVELPGMIIERMARRHDSTYLLVAEEQSGVAGRGALFVLDRDGRVSCPFGDGDCVARPLLDAEEAYVQGLTLDAEGRPLLSAITGDPFASGALFARLQSPLLRDGFE
jgi:hypothetical protein